VDLHTAAVLALVVAGLISVTLVARREAARLADERDRFFDRAAGLLQGATLTPTPNGYPVLAGTWRGRRFVIEPLIDMLSVRKLPSLWVKVTLVEAVPVKATTDVLMRPIGTEDFTPFPHLAHQVETPAGLPPNAVVRTDAPLGLAPPSALREAASLLADPRGKEVLVTPKGVRIVVQAAEGDRASYILRQARFPADPLDPGLLREAMDAAIAVTDAMQNASVSFQET
jgi:hypothetical protein